MKALLSSSTSLSFAFASPLPPDRSAHARARLAPALQEWIRIAPRWEISHLNCCENITLQGTMAGSRDNEEDKIERSAFLQTLPLSSSSAYSLPNLYLPRRCTNYCPPARNIGCWHKPRAWYSTRCHWHVLTRAIWTFLRVKCPHVPRHVWGSKSLKLEKKVKTAGPECEKNWH